MTMDSGSAVSACRENVGEVFGHAAPATSQETGVQAYKTKAREG